MKICIFTPPTGKITGSGGAVLYNFMQVLEPLSDEIFVISGYFDRATSDKKIHGVKIKKYYNGDNIIFLILQHGLMELLIALRIFKIFKKFDTLILFIGAGGMVLPTLSAKLMKKKVVFIATGSLSQCAEQTYKKSLFNNFLVNMTKVWEKVNYKLSDQIAVESKSAINNLGLNKYRKKISVNGAMYVDIGSFKIKKDLKDKRNLIGYIGRLSQEKGVMDFVKAIPQITKESGEIKVLIGGDGPLRDKIEKYLDENNLNDTVKLVGWIPHNELPDYLNELELVVLPSYTEGLPNIMLEAMACGTPVLATPVGGIPDVIKDGKTGFILEDNSPKYIAKNVIKILNYSDLDIIVNNARELVEKDFTYEGAVERYRKILEKV